MQKFLKQNTRVSFELVFGKRLYGKIVGVALQTTFLQNVMYIVEPVEQLDKTEYSHITLFDSQFEVEDYIDPTLCTRIRICKNPFPETDLPTEPGVQYYEIDAADEDGNYTEVCWTCYDGKNIDLELAKRIVPEFCEEIGRPDLAGTYKIEE